MIQLHKFLHCKIVVTSIDSRFDERCLYIFVFKIISFLFRFFDVMTLRLFYGIVSSNKHISIRYAIFAILVYRFCYSNAPIFSLRQKHVLKVVVDISLIHYLSFILCCKYMIRLAKRLLFEGKTMHHDVYMK